MSEKSTPTSHEPDKKGLTKYIEEEEIKRFLLAHFPEHLADSVKIAKGLQENSGNIEEYILNASVKLNILEMVLPKGKRLTYEGAVAFMECCYEGVTPPPFDDPAHLAAFVSQFAPIVIGDGNHFRKTCKVYQIFVEFIAIWMKDGKPVNERNIYRIIGELFKHPKSEELQSTKLNNCDPHHQFYSDFRGLKALADDIPWFSFDNETKSLSLDEDHKNGLALWLPILKPIIGLKDVFGYETAQFELYLAQQKMSKRSTSNMPDPVNNGSLTEYIKEDKIRRHLFSISNYPECLAASLQIAKMIHGNLPNLEQFIINVCVKLNFLEMVLPEGKFLTYEEAVEFIKCYYEGVTPPPFDDPAHLAAFVSQFAPIVIGNGKRFKTTTKAYQVFVQYIAFWMKTGRRVNEKNIHKLICEFSKEFEKLDPQKRYSHQPFLSDFKGLKALADDIPWFSFDDETKSLSFKEHYKNGLALWLYILRPLIQLRDFSVNETARPEGDCAQKSQETSSLTDNSSDRDKQEEKKKGKSEEENDDVFAVTEEVKKEKIMKVLHDLFNKQKEIALNQIGSLYFEEIEKQKETYKNKVIVYKVSSVWLFYALQKMGSEKFKQEPQAFLENEKKVVEFIQNNPDSYKIDSTDQSVSLVEDILDAVSSHVYAFVGQYDNPVRLEDITIELNRHFPRLPSCLVELEKMGQMQKFYDGVPLLIKVIDGKNIFYMWKSKIWPANP